MKTPPHDAKKALAKTTRASAPQSSTSRGPLKVSEPVAFATLDDLLGWLSAHHDSESELWVRIFKKDSGTPSVTWNDCVVAGLTWGWIDGQKQSLDDASFLQRMTPRRPKSNWSQKNCEHAERLIAEGRMQPPGLAHVEAARRDGRWENAYAGSATMEMPPEFLLALRADPRAQAVYDGLDRANVYAIYHRVHTAKRAETRAKLIERVVAMLAAGETFHPRPLRASESAVQSPAKSTAKSSTKKDR